MAMRLEKIVAFGLIFMLLGGMGASAQSLQLFEGSYEELVKEASRKGKPYMVDFYTSWCGYCRKLDQTTFRDAQVVEALNNGFLVLKVNAEQGEGPRLARQFRVTGFPTMLFFDSKGNLKGKIPGYVPAQRFLGELKRYEEDVPKKEEKTELTAYFNVQKDLVDSLEAVVLAQRPENDRALEQKAFTFGQGQRSIQFREMMLEVDGDERIKRLNLQYALGARNSEMVWKLLKGLEGQLSEEEKHLYALKRFEEGDQSLALNQWLNQLGRENKNDVWLMGTKVALAIASGEQEDAKDGLKKMKKEVKKQKVEPPTFEVLEALVKGQ